MNFATIRQLSDGVSSDKLTAFNAFCQIIHFLSFLLFSFFLSLPPDESNWSHGEAPATHLINVSITLLNGNLHAHLSTSAPSSSSSPSWIFMCFSAEQRNEKTIGWFQSILRAQKHYLFSANDKTKTARIQRTTECKIEQTKYENLTKNRLNSNKK